LERFISAILGGFALARWSDAMKFDVANLHSYKFKLEKFGVYELGFIKGSFFYPKYVGKAGDQTLYARLRQYHYPSSESKIPPQLQQHFWVHRSYVWFHVFETIRPFETEQRLLERHKIGADKGLYEWNRKYG
jgi:hypothetical protein